MRPARTLRYRRCHGGQTHWYHRDGAVLTSEPGPLGRTAPGGGHDRRGCRARDDSPPPGRFRLHIVTLALLARCAESIQPSVFSAVWVSAAPCELCNTHVRSLACSLGTRAWGGSADRRITRPAAGAHAGSPEGSSPEHYLRDLASGRTGGRHPPLDLDDGAR